MNNKLIIISIDGMRPDGFLASGSTAVKTLTERCTYTLNASTVFPSVTLPCHMSIFYGVPPARHGILSNVFVPQVHSIKGIFEKVSEAGGSSAVFYGWEPLRDVAPAGSCRYAVYVNAYTEESVDTVLTDKAIELINSKRPDVVFLYMVDTDEKGGHDSGWMTEEYLRRVRIATENAERIINLFGEEYSVIITADHGGHDRMHGTTSAEDMTVPMFYFGKDFEAGKKLDGGSTLDLAPTVAKLLGFSPEKEWEGKSII